MTALRSVAWLLPAFAGGRPGDGESDFVILHPKKGLLTIEVKGGQISYNPVDGWRTLPYNSTRHKSIRNPFDQARDNKHSLRRKLASLPAWHNRLIQDGHAVAFPDVVTPAYAPSPDADPRIIISTLDLDILTRRIREIFDFWAGNSTRFNGYDQEAVRLITDMLGTSWETYAPRLGDKLNQERDHLVRLTEEQFELLESLSRHRRAVIAGPAGSGKTMLALKKAQKLASEGIRTLLVCYNTALADYLRTITPANSGLIINSFHQLCGEYTPHLQLENKSEEFFGTILPDALMVAADTLSDDRRFDAIIVDEGQDFRPNWYLALQFLLREKTDSIFYIFYDDNQNLYKNDLSGLNVGEPFLLTKNCRNTRYIFNQLISYYRGQAPVKSQGPEGEPVQIQNYSSIEDLRAQLTELTIDLVYNQKVLEQSIVLLARSIKDEPLAEINRLGPFKLLTQGDPSHDQLRLSTIYSYKGLDRPVVILILDAGINLSPELIYVGMSRACNRLFIFKPPSLKLL